jgi:hypothetical protein
MERAHQAPRKEVDANLVRALDLDARLASAERVPLTWTILVWAVTLMLVAIAVAVSYKVLSWGFWS